MGLMDQNSRVRQGIPLAGRAGREEDRGPLGYISGTT